MTRTNIVLCPCLIFNLIHRGHRWNRGRRKARACFGISPGPKVTGRGRIKAASMTEHGRAEMSASVITSPTLPSCWWVKPKEREIVYACVRACVRTGGRGACLCTCGGRVEGGCL